MAPRGVGRACCGAACMRACMHACLRARLRARAQAPHVKGALALGAAVMVRARLPLCLRVRPATLACCAPRPAGGGGLQEGAQLRPDRPGQGNDAWVACSRGAQLAGALHGLPAGAPHDTKCSCGGGPHAAASAARLPHCRRCRRCGPAAPRAHAPPTHAPGHVPRPSYARVCFLTLVITRRAQVKALLRRATARDALQKYDEAEKDLRSVLAIEANNKQAREDLQVTTMGGSACSVRISIWQHSAFGSTALALPP